MIPIHFTTTTSAVALTQAGNFTDFWGAEATNAKDSVYYIKIWWQGNTNTVPVVGTTKPTLTLAVQSGSTERAYTDPVRFQGPMWYAVTLNPADTDTTVLATGGDVVTLFVG